MDFRPIWLIPLVGVGLMFWAGVLAQSPDRADDDTTAIYMTGLAGLGLLVLFIALTAKSRPSGAPWGPPSKRDAPPPPPPPPGSGGELDRSEDLDG
ncbi:MAG: hypothetical protein AAGA42_14415 [Actinomycetota bacterium]